MLFEDYIVVQHGIGSHSDKSVSRRCIFDAPSIKFVMMVLAKEKEKKGNTRRNKDERTNGCGGHKLQQYCNMARSHQENARCAVITGGPSRSRGGAR
jgi:hypothetical protein